MGLGGAGGVSWEGTSREETADVGREAGTEGVGAEEAGTEEAKVGMMESSGDILILFEGESGEALFLFIEFGFFFAVAFAWDWMGRRRAWNLGEGARKGAGVCEGREREGE